MIAGEDLQMTCKKLTHFHAKETLMLVRCLCQRDTMISAISKQINSLGAGGDNNGEITPLFPGHSITGHSFTGHSFAGHSFTNRRPVLPGFSPELPAKS